MDRLPTELHRVICSDLSPTDLTSLALCSRNYATLVRIVLYEDIVVTDRIVGYSSSSPTPPASLWRNAHSRILALQATIMSRPSLFGPLVRSLHIIHRGWSEPGVHWMELAPFFQAMTNLRRLCVEPKHHFDALHFSEVFSAISTSLVLFECSRTLAVPDIFPFLRSHPNLSTLHLKFGDITSTISGQAQSDSGLQSALLDEPLPHLKIVRLDVGHHSLTFATALLKAATRLDHLWIEYSYPLHGLPPLPGTLHPLVASHVQSFDVCGATLTSLVIHNNPHACDNHFSWTISNILPRMPNLRSLDLVHYFPGDIGRNEPQIINTATFEPDTVTKFPPGLKTLKWVAGDTFLSSGRGLSAQGKANVKALFEILPSLEVVEYHETLFVFRFQKSEDGKIRRQTLRSDDRLSLLMS